MPTDDRLTEIKALGDLDERWIIIECRDRIEKQRVLALLSQAPHDGDAAAAEHKEAGGYDR